MDSGSKNNGPWWQPPLLFFAKLNSWIVGPVLVAYLIGRYVDSRNGTGSKYTIIAISIAFVISFTQLIRVAVAELKKKKQ